MGSGIICWLIIVWMWRRWESYGQKIITDMGKNGNER